MVSLAKASLLPNDSLPVGVKSTCSWWLRLEVESSSNTYNFGTIRCPRKPRFLRHSHSHMWLVGAHKVRVPGKRFRPDESPS